MPERTPSPHRHVILVVDDYEPLREAFQRMLETSGYEVRTAGTGAEALTAAAAESFCMVFLDVELPDMDGRDVLRLLVPAQGGNRPPVVLLSGDLDGVDAATAAGALEKPVDRRALVATVTEHAQCS